MGLFSKSAKKQNINVAIFISSRGSNMEVILKNIGSSKLKGINVRLVISDNADAKGLSIARKYNVRSEYIDPAPFKTKLEGLAEDKVIKMLQEENIELVCLAGFMRMVKQNFVKAYEGRIINIHPSILPNFKGIKAQKQAIEANAKISGCTVHFVDLGMDTGAIIAQRKVKIKKDDDEKSLSKKIIKQEYILYSKVLQDIANGKVKIPNI